MWRKIVTLKIYTRTFFLLRNLPINLPRLNDRSVLKDAGCVCQTDRGRRLLALPLYSYLSQGWTELQLFYQLHKEHKEAAYSRASAAAATKTNQETNLAVRDHKRPIENQEKVASFAHSVLRNSFFCTRVTRFCSQLLQNPAEEGHLEPALGASTSHIIKPHKTGQQLQSESSPSPGQLLDEGVYCYLKTEVWLLVPSRWLSGILSPLPSLPVASGLFSSTNFANEGLQVLLINTGTIVTLRNTLPDEAEDFSSAKAGTKPQISQAEFLFFPDLLA